MAFSVFQCPRFPFMRTPVTLALGHLTDLIVTRLLQQRPCHQIQPRPEALGIRSLAYIFVWENSTYCPRDFLGGGGGGYEKEVPGAPLALAPFPSSVA